MKHSKLILLLKSLDTAEFKRFRIFLLSPYHNTSPELAELYDLLAKYYPAFSSPRLDREAVFQNLFPGKPFDLNKIRKLMSALTRIVEAYLPMLELERDDFQKRKLLAKAYGRRGLHDAFEKEMRGMIGELHAAPARGREQYCERLLLYLGLFFYGQTDKQRAGQALLVQAMKQLDAFYVLTKLQLAAEMRTRENILSEQYSIRLLDEAVRESRDTSVHSNPLYAIYAYLVELHQESGSPGTLDTVIRHFKTVLPTIDRQERQNILHHLLNHCIRLVNQGNASCRPKLFELYQLGIENGLLVENSQMTELSFSNIVSIGSSLGAFDWTRDFIDRHTVFLKDEVRDEVRALSLALWHFNRQEYEQAERALLGYGFTDMFNLLKSRCLLIRIYFEQFLIDGSNHSFLLNQLDAFNQFIRRHRRIARDKKSGYLNFTRFTKKLAQKRGEKKDLYKLRDQLTGSIPVFYKEWLLEKIEAC